MDQDDAIDCIVTERYYQDDKHGTIEEQGHEIGEWLILIEAELEEAKAGLVKGKKGRDHVMSEIIQIAALALAAIEQHGAGE